MDPDDLIIDESPLPPRAPDLGRSLRMRPPQLVTLAVLGLIVVTALAGVYNERKMVKDVSVRGVDARVEYTTRFRFQQTDIVSVMIRNNTAAMVDSIRVGVDTAYMAGFSDVTMVPEPMYPYVTQLLELPAGESREVRVEARGDRFGMHRGTVMIAIHGDTVRVPLSTFVIP
jgi:hypothetical protein